MTKLPVNLGSFILKGIFNAKLKILQSEKIQEVHTNDLIALREWKTEAQGQKTTLNLTRNRNEEYT